MAAPTHIEVTINAMHNESPQYARLAERGEDAHFYDVEAREVETDMDHPDWTGMIEVRDEATCSTYDNAVQMAQAFCAKHGLPIDAWDEEGG